MAQLVLKPLADGNEAQVVNRQERLLLQQKVPARPVEQHAARIVGEQRAVVALRLPFVAVGIHVVGTVAGEGPAVVERPDDGLARSCQIAEQGGVVQVVAVNVVQMNDVGVYRLDVAYQPSGRQCRHQAVVVKQS